MFNLEEFRERVVFVKIVFIKSSSNSFIEKVKTLGMPLDHDMEPKLSKVNFSAIINH